MRNFLRVAKMRVRVFDKDYKYVTEEFDIQNLRMAFNITKSSSWAANSGILKVWNLRDQTRNLMKDYRLEVELYAGYEQGDNLQLIFAGQSTAVMHHFQQPEIITTIECGDGDRYLNNAFASFSYGPDTPAKDVITSIADFLGLKVAVIEGADLIYRNGFYQSGMAKEVLDKVTKYLNLQASIQNNLLFVYPITPTAQNLRYQISESTGMISIPERFTYRRYDPQKAIQAPTTGYRVSTILKPLIIPSNTIMLSSSRLNISNQAHRVEVIRHIGDTYGQEWTSNMEVTLIP